MENATEHDPEIPLTRQQKTAITRRRDGSYAAPKRPCPYCGTPIGVGSGLYVHIAVKHPGKVGEEAWRKDLR